MSENEHLNAIRLDVLEARLAQLADELDCERKINHQQNDELAQRQAQLNHQAQSNRRWIEVIGVAVLSFVGVILIVLTGLRLEFGWGSFALPAGLLESGAIAAAASALFQYVSNKRQQQS